MAGEWTRVPLGDLVQNFDSRRMPLSSCEREKRRGPYPYYGATGVMDYIDDYLFEGLHLLIAEDGSVETAEGKPFLQLVDGKFWVNNHAHVLKASTDEDTRFLYYALSTVAIRPYTSGSVQAKLSQANMNLIPVPYPPAERDRRAIAHILGTLDDKIELNRRMSATLEEMARALFKSWFIDFEPVRRNAARARNQPSPLTPLPGGEGRTTHYRGGFDFSGLIETARELRRKQTPAEAMLWEVLRDRRFMGLKFRRQHQLGDYVVDFYCHELRLVLELDGGIHASKRDKDHKRDAWLKARGYKVLRFPNEQLWDDPDTVLRTLADVVMSTEPNPPSPSGRRVGDEGSVEELDRLFPARLVDSELGPIPEGWKVGTVGDLAEVSSGKRPNVRYPEVSEQATVPLWGGNGPMAFVPEALIDEPILLTGRVGTLGSVFRITTPCWPSDNTLVLRANQQATFEYLFLQLQQIDFTPLNRGSTQPLLTQTDLKALPLLLPDLAVLERFSALAHALYKRNDEAVNESRALAALRDALLPKLISGEIRVKDAERFLEERGL